MYLVVRKIDRVVCRIEMVNPTQYSAEYAILPYPASPFITQETLEMAGTLVTDEIWWNSVRFQRDQLLAESEWTQAVDAPLDDISRTAWKEYRQALWGIDTAYSNPEDVIWPEKPETGLDKTAPAFDDRLKALEDAVLAQIIGGL